MKKVIVSFVALCAVAVAGCKKEPINVEKPQDVTTAKNAIVVHNYIYDRKEYAITYELNSKYEVVSVGGDVEEFRNLTVRLKQNPKFGYLLESQDEQTKTYNIRIFDSPEKMDTYCNVTDNGNNRSCTNFSNNGVGTFKFYRDINYQNEYLFLRRPSCSYFQQQWLDEANDNISSFEMISASYKHVDLFDGSCYSGMYCRLLHSVANLHYVHVGFYWFTPVYAGDFCASIKGSAS
ncbi:MAG: hypothetical protein ACRC3B_09715 [Bacteroidia bacterium]